MNAWPTRSPTTTRSSQYERDAESSRSSFASSQRPVLGERKKHLFEPGVVLKAGSRTQLGHRSLAHDAPTAEQHEAIANARRVGELMDREKKRAPERRELAERAHHVARLT